MPPSRRSAVALVVLGALAILALGWWWTVSRTAAPAERARVSVTPTARVLARAAQPSPVVHVAGAVRRPGVYRIRPGGRVRDAVQRAGGPAPSADPNAINLAARLVDGQQVLVPRRLAVTGAPSGGAAAGGPAAASAPVSLNAATAEQLDGLDGVGPATAAKIIAWRTQHGGFASVDDLAQVSGIGPRRLEALRPLVTP